MGASFTKSLSGVQSGVFPASFKDMKQLFLAGLLFLALPAFAQEDAAPKQPQNPKRTAVFHLETHSLLSNYSHPESPENTVREGFGIGGSVGFELTPGFRPGLGLGFDWYENDAGGDVLLPFFLELSGQFSARAVKPVYRMQLGYSFPVSDGNPVESNAGGVFLYPAIGLQFPVKSGLAIHLDAGYKFQNLTRTAHGQYFDGWWGWGWNSDIT
ncbi:MAG: hypothetical protein D6714_07130, partial [Bacteroidetes bacterium]